MLEVLVGGSKSKTSFGNKNITMIQYKVMYIHWSKCVNSKDPK